LANQRGGHDNITIVVLKVPDENSLASIADTIQVPITDKKPAKRRRKGCFLVLIILVLMTLIGLAGFFYLMNIDADPNNTPIYPISTFSETLLPSQTIKSPYPTDTTKDTILSPSPVITLHIPLESTRIPYTLTPWPTNTELP